MQNPRKIATALLLWAISGSEPVFNRPALAEGTAVSGPSLDLAHALSFAIEHNPAIDAARLTQDIRTMELKNARAAMLPSADVNSTNGLQDQIPSQAGPGTTAPVYSQLSLSVSENLYDNGASLTRYSIAGFNV